MNESSGFLIEKESGCIVCKIIKEVKTFFCMKAVELESQRDCKTVWVTSGTKMPNDVQKFSKVIFA